MINIPLIGQNIRPDEVSIRAIKTFEFLDKVVDQIFDRIDARIAKNMTRIGEINHRLERASEKIEKLKTSKKAIRMYSPAQYPIEHPPNIYPTFDSSFKFDEIDFNYKLDLPIESTDYKQYADKLQFFHLKTPKRMLSQNPNLLDHATSINSLISFYNNENIYLRDTVTIKEREPQQIEQNTDDDTTDFSRFSSMIRNKQHGDNFHYLPTLSQAPEFEFPVDLPDLEGIAGDISFSVPDEELQATSFRTLNIVNDLPNIMDLMQAETKKLPEIAKLPDVQHVNEIPPPPPPSIPANIPVANNIPPPPPPPIPQNFAVPPPPPPPIPMDSISNKQSTAKPKATASSDDARSSLLKAIRDAGGKPKLKSVPAADEHEPDQMKKKPVKDQPMDLMSEMHAKLLLRRRGIAGSKVAKKEKSSIMARVSSLIPPPPKKGATTSDDSDSSSDNNDDDTAWD